MPMPTFTSEAAQGILRRLLARTEYPDGEEGCWISTYTPSMRYPVITLTGPRRNVPVHQLAHAILNPDDPTCPERPMVLHWCGDNRCWRPGHLRAGTNAENMADAIRHGTYSMNLPDWRPAGEQHGMAKLTWEKVRAIRERFAAGGVTKKALALEYGVRESAIRKVISGQRWREQ